MTAQLVAARNGGRCLRCGRPGSQIHHRLPRGAGGTSNPKINSPSNLVWLDFACHAEIESHRTVSYRTGWLVRRGADPAEQYLINLHDQMIMLLPDGTMTVNDLGGVDDAPPF